MTDFVSYRQQLRESALTYRQTGFHLHPYQQEAADAVWAAWQAGHRHALVSLPTGTGKTEVAVDLIRRMQERDPSGRVLFLTHRRELAAQTADRIRLRLPHWAGHVGIVMGGQCEDDRRIVVATVQSLVGHTDAPLALLRRLQCSGTFGFLTIDECHHAMAKGYRDVVEALERSTPALRHLGLTATPVRHDQNDLSKMYTLAYYRSIRWAVDSGYLVSPEGIRVNTDLNLASVRCQSGDFVDEALGAMLNSPAFNDMLVKLYREFLAGLPTLIFCATVKHAEAVREEFRQAGISAGLIVGTTPDDRRRETIAAFVRQQMSVIVNVGVFTEGIDIPCAEGLIMARPTKSPVLYTQIVGRVLRLSPGKVKATVVDVTGTGQTLFTLDDMMESPAYQRAVKAGIAGMRREAELTDEPATGDGPETLRYWTEVTNLLATDRKSSPVAWYSFQGRSVAALAHQQYALLMPPAGRAVTSMTPTPSPRTALADARMQARLEWQRQHAEDFTLYWIHDGTCEPVDWDRDYDALLSIASTWMEDKTEPALSARERRWRYTEATERQIDSLARRGVIPNGEWLRVREREVGVRLLGGTASNLLSYRIALAAYAAAGFTLPPAARASEESAEARFRRLLREQALASNRQSRQPGKG